MYTLHTLYIRKFLCVFVMYNASKVLSKNIVYINFCLRKISIQNILCNISKLTRKLNLFILYRELEKIKTRFNTHGIFTLDEIIERTFLMKQNLHSYSIAHISLNLLILYQSDLNIISPVLLTLFYSLSLMSVCFQFNTYLSIVDERQPIILWRNKDCRYLNFQTRTINYEFENKARVWRHPTSL